MTIKRQLIVPIVVVLLVLGAVGYWGYNQYQEKQQLEIYMGNKYQQAFYEMIEHIEQLQVLLGKTLVSTSPRQNILILTDIWSHANAAQAELNRLPLSAKTVYTASKFLSQTGDYAYVMARQNAEGEVMTAENRETLAKLREHAIEIGQSLIQLQNQAFAGDVNWLELVQGAKREIKDEGDEASNALDEEFDAIGEKLTQLPTLIYDGPFSDHIIEAEPRGLKGENISKDKAREIAREVVDLKDREGVEISDGTTVKGKIPAYNFQIKTENEGVFSVDISIQGGQLVNLLNNRNIPETRISQSQAVDKAKDYLASRGYPNMEATYSEVNENIAYISFAYQEGDVIYYPDIINVQVALDNAQVIAVEALPYLMSHQERDPGKPEITEEEVRNLASGTLEKIENIRLAVIPEESLKETFTYEVRGSIGEETYLIYYNAKTGDEEQILKVIKGQEGTFAI